MSKHTAGPWHVKGTNPPRVYARDGLDIIAQCDSMDEMNDGQELANAVLIASAPDLLAERDRLLIQVAELRAALEKTLSLVAKGAAEHAYDNMVAGRDYAGRVYQQASAILAKVSI